MQIPPSVPDEKRGLLASVVGELSRVSGVRAVVLGGSYARGTHHAASDLDIGIYYFEHEPFEIAAIRGVAEAIALQPPTVTGFYGWGAWVNGGAWIQTTAGKVDFIYRNLDQVTNTIAEAEEGVTRHDYDQQPVFGYYSVAYLAETQICWPLWDPDGLIAGLKRRVARYPSRLKERIISDSLWSAEFGIIHARGYASSGDVYATAGCLARIASNLTQGLFAMNEQYFLNDKKAIEALAAFASLPADYVERLTRLLAHVGSTSTELMSSVGELELLWKDVVTLAGGEYRSRYRI